MSASKELEAEVSATSSSIQHYVKALQAENSRLVKQLAKLEAQLTTANSMVEGLKEGKTPNPVHSMTDAELMEIAKGGK